MNRTMIAPSSLLAACQLDGVSSYFTGIAFDKNATASQLFQVVLVFAVAWFLIFYVVKSILRPFVHNKSWLLEALERHYERSAKKMLDDLKIEMTKEECIAWNMNDWPRMQCIYLQHFVGSLFCVPSLFGIGDPSITSSLAVCGILSEIGWELQDMVEIISVRAFCKNGKAAWPDAIVLVFLIHHSLSTILGLPMVIYYRENKSLHWLCFDLQFAATIAMVAGEATKMLNVSKPSSLRLFKVLNFIALVTMMWTRVIHYIYLCFELYITWWNDKAYAFLLFGLPLSAVFFMFSLECCVKPFYKNLVKFLHVSTAYETLSPNATLEKRRTSVANLDNAVAELLDGDGMMELAHIVAPFFVNRKPSRRESVPVLSSRKRVSLVLLHSRSFGDESFEKKNV